MKPTTHRVLLLVTALLVVSVAVVAPVRATDKKLNVLFIAADDMNTDIGCYGVRLVKTPNLDRLAARGVRFDAAYCQQPLCGPSRASLMTGRYPDSIDMHTLNNELRKKNPDVVTIGQMFRNNGYYSARCGKIFHYNNPGQIGTDGNDDPATWDERFNPSGIDHKQEDKITRYGPQKGGLGISMAWWDPESEDEDHTDGLVAKQIVELIDKHKDKPFFIAAGFFNPHCPYVAPRKYFDLYSMKDITMQDLESAKADLEDVPPMAVQRDTKNWPYYFKDVTVDQARQCKLAYYACISFVDAQVGKLLDALDRNGLTDNTLIVFWSDHGYFIGEKGLWYKRKAFERAARMPMIIAGPGVSTGVCERPVELIDLFPTLADYCGLQPPKDLDGASLRPLLTDPAARWDRPAVTQVFHAPNACGYSIRNQRWRYTEWNRGDAGRELYDHDNDPDEVHNLANDPHYKQTVDELSSQLQPYMHWPKK
ncbi:MAG: sulfatase-like hydrolase/transferase [Phycisphaera sp.]|nr:sulfatase-like hydrolase/transferase [Phycisphaera sp.]